MRFLLRWILRIATWTLAALGIKALYDRLSPKAQEYRQPAAQVLDKAKTAAYEVADHAKTAATDVVTDAQTRFSDAKDTPVHDGDVAERPNPADLPKL